MRKTFLAAAALATLASSLIVEAQALPAPRIAVLDEATAITPIRDRCGWRRHWSPRLRHCVWDGRDRR
jgi:hypothetical protein